MIGVAKDAIITRRGKQARNFAKVGAARRLLTLTFYGLRGRADPLPVPVPRSAEGTAR